MNEPSSGIRTYGYLICTECRLSVLLGATTAGPDMTLGAITEAAYRPPWRTSPLSIELALAIWRLVTDHAAHVLRVVAECWPEFDTYATVALAGVYPTLPPGRPAYLVTDITYQAYTLDWPYRPAVEGFRGATPAPGRLTRQGDGAATAVNLVCLPCRIAVDLGDTTIQPDGTATAFTFGPTGGLHSCSDDTATTALLRMLIDHAGHDLLVIPLDSFTYDHYIADEWVLHIHRDADHVEHRGEITWAQYIDGWPDAPIRPRHIGITPIARRSCAAGGRIHHDCHHPHPPHPLDHGETRPDRRPTDDQGWLRTRWLRAATPTDGYRPSPPRMSRLPGKES